MSTSAPGMTQASRELPLSTSYIPDGNPGPYGGGTYTTHPTEPTIRDYENVFGPSARDIKDDLQKYKRHGRWHLPDILQGPNPWLTDRIDGLITDATNSPFTSIILPYKYHENVDGKIKWNVWSFDEAMASRVPYESAARTLTQTKRSFAGYAVRHGLAINLEHNFMMTPKGRENFQNQLNQLIGSIQYTNDLDVHVALILAPSYETFMRQRYISSDSDNPVQVCRQFVDLFGFMQKNQNALDIMIEEAKYRLKSWGGPMPNFMLTNSKLTFQLTMIPDRTNYVSQGPDGQKRLKDGPDLASYRGLKIIHTRAFSMETGQPPRDMLRRRVRVAEYYRIVPHKDNARREFEFYNEARDTWFTLSFKDLLKMAFYRRTKPHARFGTTTQPGENNHQFLEDLVANLEERSDRQSRGGAEEEHAADARTVHFGDESGGGGEDDAPQSIGPHVVQQFRPSRHQWLGADVTQSQIAGFNDLLKKALGNVWRSGNMLSLAENDQLPTFASKQLFCIAPGSPSIFTPQFPGDLDTIGETGCLAMYPRLHLGTRVVRMTEQYIHPETAKFLLNAEKQDMAFAYAKRYHCRYYIPLSKTGEKYDFGLGVRQPYGAYNEPNNMLALKHAFTRSTLANVIHKNMFLSSEVINELIWNTDKLSENVKKAIFTAVVEKYQQGKAQSHSSGSISVQINQEISKILQHHGAILDKDQLFTRTYGIWTWPEESLIPFENIMDVFLPGESPAELQEAMDKCLLLSDRRELTIQNLDNLSNEKVQPFAKLAEDLPVITSSDESDFFDILQARLFADLFRFINHEDKQKLLQNAVTKVVEKMSTMVPVKNRHQIQIIATNVVAPYSSDDVELANKLLAGFKLHSRPPGGVDPHGQQPPGGVDPRNQQPPSVVGPHGRQPPGGIGPRNQQPPSYHDPRNQQPPSFYDPRNQQPPNYSTDPSSAPGFSRARGTKEQDLIDKYLANTEVVIIRPNIEHNMLGIIMGMGGEDLGSTLWGQTELSVYDDSMHGIWGMSYKYHERAIVFNEKNLIRLWDIAYDGYNGGKDDTWVNWTDPTSLEKFQNATTDPTKSYNAQSMMVMAFVHDRSKKIEYKNEAALQNAFTHDFQRNWPSPIVFYDRYDYNQQGTDTGDPMPLPVDYDNVHVVDVSEFRVFNKPLYAAYFHYQDLMPPFRELHQMRKSAGHSSHENDTPYDSLAFQGSMRIKTENRVIEDIQGSGHHGPDFTGVASVRAGKGYKIITQPTLSRTV